MTQVILKELDEHQVLAMTPKILQNLMQHSYFDLSSCNLLIFDECHHATKVRTF